MNKDLKLNIRHLFVVAAGLDKDCIDVVEEIYNTNKEGYNEIYLNSRFHGDLVKQIFSMKTEDRINKVSAIVEKAYRTNSYLVVEKLIKGIHPSIVNFVKKSYNIDLEKFRLKYLDGKYVSEEKIFCIYSAIMYFGYISGKGISESIMTNFVLEKWNGYISQALFVDKNATEKIRDKISLLKRFDREVVEPYYSVFDLEYEEKINSNLNCFFDDCIEKRTLAEFGLTLEDGTRRMNISENDYHRVRNEQFREGFIRYIGCINRYIISLGLDSSDMMNETIITNEVLNDIFEDFEKSKRYNNVPDSEKELYTIACLYIYNLVDLYKESKDMYLNKAKEEKYKELKSLEKKLTEKNEIISKKLEEANERKKEQSNELRELQEKIKSLQKENAKLNGDLNKKEREVEGLISQNNSLKIELQLKDEIILSKDDVQEVEDVSFEEKIDYINQHKIAIFGGRNNIKSLSEILDNVLFFDSKNQDISGIKNCDMIFINYEYFNHAFSKKIDSNILKYDVTRGYIHGSNISLIIEDIYVALKKIND